LKHFITIARIPMSSDIHEIDIQKEELFSLTAASKLRCFKNRRGGKPINVSTLWRYATDGFQGVILETKKVGGTRATSMEAVERFINAVTALAERKPAALAPSPTCQRRQQIEAAEARLRKAGV
jgi:hypothetical protein